MRNNELKKQIKGKLIVSCQALEDEPMHGSIVMAKMALAADQGGAAGIRANGVEDIAAIKKVTNLPIIGLIKRKYKGSDVYITPTRKEVDELLKVGVDMIAIDATKRARPNGEDLQELIHYIQKHDQQILADISTVEEGISALEFGVDYISTTLSGYTDYTCTNNEGPDFELVKKLTGITDSPVFAEGRIGSPQEAKMLLDSGAFAVIVGSAITRPQQITETYVKALNVKSGE